MRREPGHQVHRVSDDLRCPGEAASFDVREGAAEFDDAAGLREPDLAAERAYEVARAPALEAVDIGVVVQSPDLRHGRVQATDLALEFGDVAQTRADVLLVENVESDRSAAVAHADQRLVVLGGRVRGRARQDAPYV